MRHGVSRFIAHKYIQQRTHADDFYLFTKWLRERVRILLLYSPINTADIFLTQAL